MARLVANIIKRRRGVVDKEYKEYPPFEGDSIIAEAEATLVTDLLNYPEEEVAPPKMVWVDLKGLLLNLLRHGDGQEYGTEDLFGLVHEFIEASDQDSINHWTFRLPEALSTRVQGANSLIDNADNLEELQRILQKADPTEAETERAGELAVELMRGVRHSFLEFARLLLSTGVRLGSRPVEPGGERVG